jgi:hypothetical protein
LITTNTSAQDKQVWRERVGTDCIFPFFAGDRMISPKTTRKESSPEVGGKIQSSKW